MIYDLEKFNVDYVFGQNSEILNKDLYDNFAEFPIKNTNFSILIDSSFKNICFSSKVKLFYCYHYSPNDNELVEIITNDNEKILFHIEFFNFEGIDEYFNRKKLKENKIYIKDYENSSLSLQEIITFEVNEEKLFYHKLKYDENIVNYSTDIPI